MFLGWGYGSVIESLPHMHVRKSLVLLKRKKKVSNKADLTTSLVVPLSLGIP